LKKEKLDQEKDDENEGDDEEKLSGNNTFS